MGSMVLLELQIKPDMWETAKDTFRQILPDTRAFAGFQRLVVNQDPDNNVLLLTEEWDSKEHHQKYMAWRTERGDIEKLGALLSAPPSIRYLEMTDI